MILWLLIIVTLILYNSEDDAAPSQMEGILVYKGCCQRQYNQQVTYVFRQCPPRRSANLRTWPSRTRRATKGKWWATSHQGEARRRPRLSILFINIMILWGDICKAPSRNEIHPLHEIPFNEILSEEEHFISLVSCRGQWRSMLT